MTKKVYIDMTSVVSLGENSDTRRLANSLHPPAAADIVPPLGDRPGGLASDADQLRAMLFVVSCLIRLHAEPVLVVVLRSVRPLPPLARLNSQSHHQIFIVQITPFHDQSVRSTLLDPRHPTATLDSD